MDLYALDRKGKFAIEYAIGEPGNPANRAQAVPEEQLHVLLKAYLKNGFDIFKKATPHPQSVSAWELLCGTGRITEQLLLLLKENLKGRLTLQLLEEGRAIMDKYGVTLTEEISEALVKIATQVVEEHQKHDAIQTLFIYHHRRQLYQANQQPPAVEGVLPIERLPKYLFTRITRYIL